MAEKVKVWFDPEGDFLEVRFSDAPGFMRETSHDALMERVDEQGQVLGFSILGVSRFRKERPFEAELSAGKSKPDVKAAKFPQALHDHGICVSPPKSSKLRQIFAEYRPRNGP